MKENATGYISEAINPATIYIDKTNPNVSVEYSTTKNTNKNWREFLETQEFYLEAAGN